MIARPCDARSACRWLILLVLGAMIPRPAGATGSSDILYLNKFGEGISNVSWCNDRAFTYKTYGPSRQGSAFPPEYSRTTTLNMFTMETQQARPIVVSDYNAFGADCVRNGEYVFLEEFPYSAKAVWDRSGDQVSSNRFVLTRPRTERERTIAGKVGPGFRPGGSLRTAPDGSVYSVDAGTSLNLDDIAASKRSSFLKKAPYHTLTRDGVAVSFINPSASMAGPPVFPVYGFGAVDAHANATQGGSYDCSTGRPGCTADKREAGYYLYVAMNDAARNHVLFTITPRHEPIVTRWPIVSRSRSTANLEIVGAVLDAKNCYVLLEPVRWDPANKVGGRLKLDVYVAQCAFAGRRLEYDEPVVVARKQASFMFPKVSLNGDFLVIEDFRDFASQLDDQIEFEGEAMDRPNICVKFFRNGTWPLKQTNAICIRQGKNDEGGGLEVSPEGGFVTVRSKTNPLVVGREFRNDGSAPAWLNNGDAR